MNYKQILGIMMGIGGLILFCIGVYIKQQVAEGNSKIFDAQRKVDQGNSLFSRNPFTQEIGKGLTSGAQKQINEGKQQVLYYEVVADRCQLGGVALVLVGAGMAFFCRTKKKGKR